MKNKNILFTIKNLKTMITNIKQDDKLIAFRYKTNNVNLLLKITFETELNTEIELIEYGKKLVIFFDEN